MRWTTERSFLQNRCHEWRVDWQVPTSNCFFFASMAIFNYPERSWLISGALAAANHRETKKSRRGNETKSFIRANLIKLFLVDYSCQIFNSAVAVHHHFQNSHPRWFVLENVVSLESRREEESVPLWSNWWTAMEQINLLQWTLVQSWGISGLTVWLIKIRVIGGNRSVRSIWRDNFMPFGFVIYTSDDPEAVDS